MENEHPIESLMRTTLESIKNMVDVNTILGDPVETPDGKVIVPISRVTFGFAAGGTEYEPASADGDGVGGGDGRQRGTAQADGKGRGEQPADRLLPFGGGSGAGISIQPVGFLVVGRDDMRLLPVDGQILYDRLIDLAPKLLDGLQNLARGRSANRSSAQTPVCEVSPANTDETATTVGQTTPIKGTKPLIRLRGRNQTDLS
ncbi:MAG: GerW family sporulation protein [Betaproteobacteria bacterium]